MCLVTFWGHAQIKNDLHQLFYLFFYLFILHNVHCEVKKRKILKSFTEIFTILISQRPEWSAEVKELPLLCLCSHIPHIYVCVCHVFTHTV